jgi:hypothetical protein
LDLTTEFKLKKLKYIVGVGILAVFLCGCVYGQKPLSAGSFGGNPLLFVMKVMA